MALSYGPARGLAYDRRRGFRAWVDRDDRHRRNFCLVRCNAHKRVQVKSSQVNTLPKAKSKTRSKQNKDMHKCSSLYSERGVPLPVLTSGGE